MAAHSKYSPSQAKRFRSCPGALALCATLPDFQRDQSGEAARIGTCTHALIERCLQEGSEPEKYRGRIIELFEEQDGVSILRPGAKLPGRGRICYLIDEDMISGATVMTDYVRERMRALDIKREDLQLETRTNPLPDREDTSGTADVTIDGWPEILEVIDYKNGGLTVEADSDQPAAYLLGKAIDTEFTHGVYRTTIVQPNAPHEYGKIRSFDYTKAELLAFQKAYRTDVERCDAAAAHKLAPTDSANINPKWAEKYLNAGTDASHCTFCPAAPKCPARLALAQQDAGVDFADDPEDFPEPKTEAEVAHILAWAPRMEKLISVSMAYALRAVQNGFKVPGFKAVQGRSTRVLVDMEEPKLVRAIVREGFVADKALLYTAPSLKSGPQIEKLVESKRRAEFNERFLVKPPGALTLAPESDPRPGIECSPGDDFADADADEMDFG